MYLHIHLLISTCRCHKTLVHVLLYELKAPEYYLFVGKQCWMTLCRWLYYTFSSCLNRSVLNFCLRTFATETTGGQHDVCFGVFALIPRTNVPRLSHRSRMERVLKVLVVIVLLIFFLVFIGCDIPTCGSQFHLL